MAQTFDTVREMVVAVAQLVKRPTKAETSAKASKPKHIPPPSPPPVQFPHIRTAPLIVGVYEMPLPGMLVGVSLP